MSKALLIVDVQNDFISGSLAVPKGEEVIPVLNSWILGFNSEGAPVCYSMDAHPNRHCSFQEQGGPWPAHCVMGTEGQKLHSGLVQPVSRLLTFAKGYRKEKDAYSAFDGTSLDVQLRKEFKVDELFVGGLATDYCVKATVLDALKLEYKVSVIRDGCRAVNVQPGDGDAAFAAMVEKGAKII